ncbi:methyl-accepting chemotaxis protein [Brasilonema octagenarum]|uniref:Chemotaxis protein n=1 Tax=Brasilonema octagenarum UFV-OR1 TaxID=417115 RepID=A0ABX1MEG6_9CYAN|nr:GAF domain-containing protein [Brasilonema octagenarum]NMF67042.1 hypothetical protein [Brasilonema octagenarum UFV-OR1]
MTQPSSQKQAEQQLNQSKGLQESADPKHRPQEWSLKTKAIAWAMLVSMLPVLTVGTTTYYFGSQLTAKQISQARQADTTSLAEAELGLHRLLSLLLIETGVTAVLAGAIAAILGIRAIRPILNAASVSTTMVNRLRRESADSGTSIVSKDELAVLETNINFVKEQLPDLLWKQEAEAERSQVFHNISRGIRQSLTQEDILRTTVEEVRKALRIDRVAIFRFDSNLDGTFVEESAAPELPKILWTTISDPCFQTGYVEQYRNGRVRAIDDIYQANLTDCHIGLLERFAVKSNLIAPILKNNQLFGLLIAHQCFEPRTWQQYEIDLFAQIAAQVGFALDYVKLLERIDTKADQAQAFINITRRIRESLNEEDVLKTTVEKTRKAMSADRVLVYGFDSNWYGTVIAESVLPGFPKALRAKIKDPCFAEGYVEKYRFGRVQATNNIYEAGLTTCHISQLEPFAVKANLVAPILKDDQLFGLLIAHQCSGPRDWQQYEIDLFTQIATQVGFALDHARLLNKVEQAYQSAEATSYEQREQKEALQLMVLELLRGSQTSVQTLSGEALSQVESLTGAYNQIQALVDSAMEMLICAQQAELQEQQLTQAVHDGHSSIDPILENLCDVQVKVMEAVEKVERLDQPFQKFSQLVGLISHIAFQIKLQAMNTVLEASRTTEGGEQFAWLADQALSQVHQLEASIAEVQLLVPEIQTQANEVVAVIEYGAEQAMRGIRLAQETQEKFNQIIMLSEQMKKLVEELVQTAPVQAKTSTSASQSILEVVSIASKTSEQVLAVAKSLDKLSTLAQNLQEDAD